MAIGNRVFVFSLHLIFSNETNRHRSKVYFLPLVFANIRWYPTVQFQSNIKRVYSFAVCWKIGVSGYVVFFVFIVVNRIVLYFKSLPNLIEWSYPLVLLASYHCILF